MKTTGATLVAIGAILLLGKNELGIYPLMLGTIMYYAVTNKKGI